MLILAVILRSFQVKFEFIIVVPSLVAIFVTYRDKLFSRIFLVFTRVVIENIVKLSVCRVLRIFGGCFFGMGTVYILVGDVDGRTI